MQDANGVVGYIDVLDARRQLFDAEISVNDAMLNEWTAIAPLYKAFGGRLTEWFCPGIQGVF